jgi:MFS family permease
MDIGIIGGVITQDAFQSYAQEASSASFYSSLANMHNLSAFGFSQLSTAAAEKADANLSANIVSVMQAGAFFGALFAYPIADKSVMSITLLGESNSLTVSIRFGRKPSLLIAALFALVGGLMQAAASGNLPCLYVG